MLGVRCGSPASSGSPVALRSPATAQLLEPLASRAHPIAARTAPICSAIARPSPLQASWVTTGCRPGSPGRASPPAPAPAPGPCRPAAAPAPSWWRGRRRDSLPRVRMSTGRHGSKRQPQQLHLERQRPGARGRGVDPGAEGSIRARSSPSSAADLALGGAPEPQGPHQPVDRQPLLAGELARPARRRPGGRSPSARAGPGRGRSPARTRGPPGFRPRRGERPSGRGGPGPALEPLELDPAARLRQRPPRQPVPERRGRRASPRRR